MSVPTKDRLSGDGHPEKRVWGIRAELGFRRLVAETMERSRKNREQIAREMGQILGRPISKGMLDECVRSRKTGRMVRFPAACVGSGNSEPFFPDILSRSVLPGKGSSNFR